MACDFICLFEYEGFDKVAVKHVHCKCDKILKTAQETVVVTKDH